MEILAWFGRFDPDASSFEFTRDVESMIGALLKSETKACPSSQPDLRSLAKANGLVRSDQEYNSFLKIVALGLVRRQLKALTSAEQDLLQTIEALDDLNQAVNLLDERLYEWSRLHQDEIVHGKELADGLLDDEIMGELARAIINLRDSRQSVEREVCAATEKIAPNLCMLAGPVLAARLISKAGSLRRLAEMPSSTIQVMGAEKALFKHLKGNALSPKHGIIYRHPAVSGANKSLRGRTARALAGKLAIAARMDYYGNNFSPDLKEALDKRLEEIKRKGRKASRKKRFGDQIYIQCNSE